jgi:hypothetical protein
VIGLERKRPHARRQLHRKKQGVKKKHGGGITIDEIDGKAKKRKKKGMAVALVRRKN